MFARGWWQDEWWRNSKTMSRSWLFPATCDERGEDETTSGVWRSHLRKWWVFRFLQRLVILLLLLVYICRLLAASRMAMKHKGMSRNGIGCLQRHVVSIEKIERWVVFRGAISRNGGASVLKSVCWFCCFSLVVYAGGWRWVECQWSAKGMRSSWLLIVIVGEHRKDRTWTSVYQSHLQKWRALSLTIRLLVLFVLFVFICRRVAARVDAINGVWTKR